MLRTTSTSAACCCFRPTAPTSLRQRRVDEQMVGQLGSDEIEAADDERLEPGGARAPKLAHQPGLADPRLAGDEDR